MSRSTLRLAIIILTLATALIHLYLNVRLGEFSLLFTLNGLGYLALLVAFLLKIPKGQERLVHYAFMAYAVVTILAWVFTADLSSPLGIVTKVIEVLLVLSLWLDLRALSDQSS